MTFDAGGEISMTFVAGGCKGRPYGIDFIDINAVGAGLARIVAR